MYGTIAKLKVKKGGLEELRKMETERQPKGYVASYAFQSDNDPSEIWMVAIFENKETYMANADSQEQDQEFRKLQQYLSAEPEWHDGEIVLANQKSS